MSTKQIENHEKKFRKGQYMSKGWKDDFDSMARKTVYRKLIGKWGVMSIDYQNAKGGETIANQIREEFIDNENTTDMNIIGESFEVDETTGEVKEAK